MCVDYSQTGSKLKKRDLMSFILLDSSNFFHNLNVIKNQIKDINKISIVLKDNAYGHGLLEIANLALNFGIKSAVVKDLKEANLISNLFKSILVLADIPSIKPKDNINITINSIEDLSKIPQKCNIELKVDSGMHRNGINISELEFAFKKIKERSLNLKGVFTHFRSSDELSSEAFWQRKNFEEIKKNSLNLCKKFNFNRPKFHFTNSATTFKFNSNYEDLVRVGIASYGYLENDYLFSNVNLKPTLSLWAEKNSTRVVKKNQRVGYGGLFIANRDMIVSNYDIGYADGFFRLTNQKFKTKCGNKILGRVSMDNISIEGDKQKVCLFDDARELASIFNTITYDILVKLSNKIEKRVI